MRDRSTEITTGVVILGIGLALAAQQLFGWRGLELTRLWPIIIVGMGVTKVITRWRTGERTAGWGVSLVLYGVLWLLYTERVFSMWQLVPAFLIAWGAGFVLQGVGFGGRRSEGRDDH